MIICEFVGGELSLVKILMINKIGTTFQQYSVWLSHWWGLGCCSCELVWWVAVWLVVWKYDTFWQVKFALVGDDRYTSRVMCPELFFYVSVCRIFLVIGLSGSLLVIVMTMATLNKILVDHGDCFTTN